MNGNPNKAIKGFEGASRQLFYAVNLRLNCWFSRYQEQQFGINRKKGKTEINIKKKRKNRKKTQTIMKKNER